MIRTAVRLLLLAVLLLLAFIVFRVSRPGPAPGQGATPRNGDDRFIRDLEEAPAPADAPLTDVADIEVATFFSRLAPNCDSNETIEYAKRGDLVAFAQCLRAGNDPWIIEAPTDEKASAWEFPGASALYIASANGSLGIVELLVRRYGVSPDWGGALQNVPVVRAIQENHYEVATFLLESGADTRRWSPFRDTALSAAVVKKDPKYLRAVLDAGAFPNEVVTDLPLLPLSIAMNQRKYEHARMLAESGACVPRDLESFERMIEGTRSAIERQAMRKVVATFREKYDPTCKSQTSYEGEYRWEPDREAAEVEIATATADS